MKIWLKTLALLVVLNGLAIYGIACFTDRVVDGVLDAASDILEADASAETP